MSPDFLVCSKNGFPERSGDPIALCNWATRSTRYHVRHLNSSSRPHTRGLTCSFLTCSFQSGHAALLHVLREGALPHCRRHVRPKLRVIAEFRCVQLGCIFGMTAGQNVVGRCYLLQVSAQARSSLRAKAI